MSNDCIPELVDPVRMARNGAELRGTLPASGLQRASRLVSGFKDDLSFSMAFDIEEDSACVVKGGLALTVELRCERCMDTYLLKVETAFALMPVHTEEQAKDVSGLHEAYVMSEGKLSPLTVLEDELILALPIVPKHEEGLCQMQIDATCLDDNETGFQARSNPFQVLESLKLRK